MRKCEEEVEQSNGTCLCSSKSYHLWIIVKCGNKVWSGKEDNDSDNLCHSNGTEHTEFCAFFCTFVLSGAEVLADKGSQRQCKACDRQEAKSLDL